ncbi:hypothetical protein HPB52_006163 [Rhipicephalus sanguineus]|uniref:Kaptin n=1 Tax=Rhipicephalus sanguineus TaxID=34632 RepID=A0A9D4QB82_RHISA|nr:hypothetical protein HPB52_006163 [Rhipicephalus sanguineus]
MAFRPSLRDYTRAIRTPAPHVAGHLPPANGGGKTGTPCATIGLVPVFLPPFAGGRCPVRDVLDRGLEMHAMLPCSDDFDSVVCGCVADIDMDGVNEVILGTYGQEVLVYKLTCQRSGKEAYGLLWHQTVSHPILSIKYMDLTGDGICELLVLSTKGLHILQAMPVMLYL